jgi:hypothetical protein
LSGKSDKEEKPHTQGAVIGSYTKFGCSKQALQKARQTRAVTKIGGVRHRGHVERYALQWKFNTNTGFCRQICSF